MTIILMLEKIALETGNRKLKKQIKRIFDYIDRKGCRIATEIEDNKILVYDATNAEYLLAITIDVNDMLKEKEI